MSESAECRRSPFLKRLMCRFEARYDEGPGRQLTANEIAGAWPADIGDTIAKTRSLTYVRDVCTVCGKTVERATHPKTEDRTDER